MSKFKLVSSFRPTGDQPSAIETIVKNLNSGVRDQTLLGVTGSGKTFTMANVANRMQKPTLVISHNKTLAAQLYQEFKEFFPDNAIHYFVSYYDYYQPEAYIPRTDTYIEKDAKINEMIDALRHASTASLLSRKDVLIVASVSCIYGLGSPAEYENASIELKKGARLTIKEFSKNLTLLQYARNPLDPRQGHFRVRENTIEIHLPTGEDVVSIEIEQKIISKIIIKKAALRAGGSPHETVSFKLFPAKHFVTPQERLEVAVANIKKELAGRLIELRSAGKILEAERLKQRTEFDMEMLSSTGFVNGIENYSRQLDFRAPGTPPHTLIDYFRHAHGDDFLVFLDESHATLPQIRGMYHGDKARKETLINYGFRLPSAADNRPLTFSEFNERIKQFLYVSATPSDFELKQSGAHIAEQLIRPTGILDPVIEVRPTANQMKDVISEVKKRALRKERSLVMALTKRLAEDISEYLTEEGIQSEYLHSEIKTLERPERIKKLRTGERDVLVGINLLREGLDLPEVSFIAILDADKEGFLRNKTTLLQIIGRAARHTAGTIIMYGDRITGSMNSAIRETDRRRKKQHEYNISNGITPRHIVKDVRSTLYEALSEKEEPLPPGSSLNIIKELEREMKKAAKTMDFERAARLRDKLKKVRDG